jgi:hypothetical protein
MKSALIAAAAFVLLAGDASAAEKVPVCTVETKAGEKCAEMDGSIVTADPHSPSLAVPANDVKADKKVETRKSPTLANALVDGYDIKATLGTTILMQKDRSAIACVPVEDKLAIGGYVCEDVVAGKAIK